MNFKEKLEKYAKAIMRVGANVQKGQLVVIRADISANEFIKELTKQAYLEGAGKVAIEYRDEEITRLNYQYQTVEELENIRKWEIEKYEDYVNRNAVFISVIGNDPNALEGLDSEKVQKGIVASSKAMSGFRKALMNDQNSWVVVGASTPKWAKTIFPELDEKEAVSKLWDLIFYTTRITENPVEEWKNHIKNLNDKANELNNHNFKYLKYTTKKGTNLEIELPKGHIWMAGNSINSKGTPFTANMPTEEVFTLPHKDGINGRIYSTKALNYNGNIIDEFYLDFEKGKVVNFGAEKGYETLKNLLSSDEGAKSLGEVALVPYDSPISNTKTMFYETLYDENASCHLALGKAYPTTITNGANLSKEELSLLGVNDSLVHVDFMVGDETLNIVGIKENGEEVQIFKDGNWA